MVLKWQSGTDNIDTDIDNWHWHSFEALVFTLYVMYTLIFEYIHGDVHSF